MTGIEMRNFESPFDSDDAELSAQERLLYNNNHHSHQHNSSPMLPGHHPGQDENHYQIPYAHLIQNHQHAYLQQHQQPQPQQHHHQAHPLHYQGVYNSNDLLNTLQQQQQHQQQQQQQQQALGANGNGNGYTLGYRDKYSLAYPVREDDSWRQTRSQHGGSGKVYRSKKKFWTIAMILILLFIILVGAVVIVIYFTVMKKDSMAQAADNGVDNGFDRGGTGGYIPHGVTTNTTDEGYDGVDTPPDTPQPLPPDSVSPPKTSHSVPPPNHNRNRDPDFYPTFDNVKVHKFDAYWHPGDSRLFSAVMTNGTVIQAFGPKKSDGTAKSIYSLSLTDMDGVTKSVRFLGQRNFASVILPSGVIVHYDWSSSNLDMEIKIFEPMVGHGEGPISHMALVDVGVRSYLLRKISKVMIDAQNRRGLPLVGNRPGSTKCFSRFPIMVTKCGGQYPYDGAFVTGEITGIDKPITMSALPWSKEADPCYTDPKGPVSNYYLPLPGQVDNDNATMIKDAYAASSAGLFAELCNIVNDQVYKERHALCSDMANKVMKSLSRQQLPNIIYSSCSTVINALHVACTAISDISAADKNQALTENGLLRSLSRRLSNSFPPGLPKQVNLKAHAFCPSSLPLSSYESTVSIQTIGGNVVEDVIHINCPDYPEVTYVDLHHLLTTSAVMSSGSNFDMVKHKMRVCSICAFEKEVSAQVVSDEMLCNNTCVRTNVLEQIPEFYIKEERQFVDQDSVYCHEFLTSVENRIQPIGKSCLGNCMSHLHVQFKIEDPKTKTVYYDQTVQCSELKNHSCKMRFGR